VNIVNRKKTESERKLFMAKMDGLKDKKKEQDRQDDLKEKRKFIVDKFKEIYKGKINGLEQRIKEAVTTVITGKRNVTTIITKRGVRQEAPSMHRYIGDRIGRRSSGILTTKIHDKVTANDYEWATALFTVIMHDPFFYRIRNKEYVDNIIDILRNLLNAYAPDYGTTFEETMEFAEDKKPEPLIVSIKDKKPEEHSVINALTLFDEEEVEKAYNTFFKAMNGRITHLKGISARKIADTEIKKKKLGKKIEKLIETLNIIKSDPELEEQQGNLLEKIADAYLYKKKYVDAKKYYKESLKKYEKILSNSKDTDKKYRIKNNMLDVNSNIGKLYFEKGILGKAEDYTEKCLKKARRFGRKKLLAQLLNNLGEIYTRKGEKQPKIRTGAYKIARKYYKERLKIVETWDKDEWGLEKTLNVTLDRIGKLNDAVGRDNKALDYRKRRLKLLENSKNQKAYANALRDTADSYVKLDRHKQALTLYYKAKDIAMNEKMRDILDDLAVKIPQCAEKIAEE